MIAILTKIGNFPPTSKTSDKQEYFVAADSIPEERFFFSFQIYLSPFEKTTVSKTEITILKM